MSIQESARRGAEFEEREYNVPFARVAIESLHNPCNEYVVFVEDFFLQTLIEPITSKNLEKSDQMEQKDDNNEVKINITDQVKALEIATQVLENQGALLPEFNCIFISVQR